MNLCEFNKKRHKKKMRVVSPSSYYSDNRNNNNNNINNNNGNDNNNTTTATTTTISSPYNNTNNTNLRSVNNKSKVVGLTDPPSFLSSKTKKSACRIVHKGTEAEKGVGSGANSIVCDYGNVLTTSGNRNNPIKSRGQCTVGISEVYPENNTRHSSIIKHQHQHQHQHYQQQDTEELLHQLNSNRDTEKVHQVDPKSNTNCTIESHNHNINKTITNNPARRPDRTIHNSVPASPSNCDIPRFILVPRNHNVDPSSSTCTCTTTTDLELKDNTFVTVTPLEEIEVEFVSNNNKGPGRSSSALPPLSPPSPGTPGLPLKKTFSHNTGTTESNTNTLTNTYSHSHSYSYTATTELRYSNSFNSRSTNLSYRDQDQDYTEEKRLLQLADCHSNNNSNIVGIYSHTHHNSIRSFNSSNRNSNHNSNHKNPHHSHKRSQSFPQNNIIGIRRSTSNTTSTSANAKVTKSSESPLRSISFSPSITVTGVAAAAPPPPGSTSSTSMTLTPHSNLGELLNASKKLQQEQAAAAAAAGTGPGSTLGGRNRRGANIGTNTGGGTMNNSSNNNHGNGNGNVNQSQRQVSSPKSRPTLTRPSSLSSKSKSTGMYFSPQEQKQYSSSALNRNGNDVSFSSVSASASKMHVSRHSYTHVQSHSQHGSGHNRSHSLSLNLLQDQNQDQGVQLLSQKNRPGMVKQSKSTGLVGTAATTTMTMNPFEDPSLVGDLHISTSGTDGSGAGGNYISNLSSATGPGVHPLQNNILGAHSGSSGNMLQFDPLKITSSASSASSRQEYPQQQQQQQQQRQHQPSPSIDTAQLSELAAALSSLKPQQTHNTAEMNPEQLKLADHQVTLGHAPKESTGTSKSHRRFLSLRGPKSLNNDEMKGVMDSMQQQPSGSGSFDCGGVGIGIGSGSSDQYDITTSSSKDKKDKKHKRAASMGIFKRNDSSLYSEGAMGERPVTPIKGLRRGRNNSSPNSSNGEDEDGSGRGAKSPSRRKRGIRLGAGKNQSRNVNVETTNGVTPHHSPRRMPNQPLETIQSNESTSSGLYPAAQCSSSGGSPTSQIKLRSSEQDPSPHQIRIPSVSDVLLQVKLCHLMEKYREIDQNFHFGVLANISRKEMEMFVDLDKKSRPNSPIRPTTANGGNALSPPQAQESSIMQSNPLTSSSSVTTSRLRNLVDAHKPIVQSIISSASDLVLAGFYYEMKQNENNITHDTTQDRPPGDRTEVAIFASDVLRQFIVVYQGSAECQAKPIRKRFAGKFKSNVAKNFRSDEEHLTVYPPFEQGYSQSGVESKVFKKLDELAEQHPFFDVIVTGHSYGGMLALLGSMRYACSRPAMMVSCFAFGCPKVGALDFRHYVNSLPNLKVTRLEYGFDPWVHAPDNPAWTHAGHTISIIPQMQSSKERKGGNEKGNKDNNQNNTELCIRAYKFGNDRPDSAANGKFIGKKGNRQEKQIDHDISSYLNAIELITKDGVSWPRQFVGEEGTGVRGMNKEKRLVC